MDRLLVAGSARLFAAFIVLYIAAFTGAQGNYYAFSGAIYIYGSNPGQGTNAVPAQCPAEHPVSCSGIGASGWCCPASNNCAWNGASAVGCCPWGQTCSGAPAGAGAGQWQPTTTYWQPTSTWYQQQTTTVYEQPPPFHTTTVAAHPQEYVGGAYCSTLYAQGPGLPTTRPGQCGEILILPANGGNKVATADKILYLWSMLVAFIYAFTVIL